MKSADRLDHIVELVDTLGFASVQQLAEQCSVSEMTVRRDLGRLAEQQRIKRTYGGAASLHNNLAQPDQPITSGGGSPALPLVDRVDVLITTSLNPQFDALLPDLRRRAISLIAESLPVEGAETVLAVDNRLAGLAIGHWAGEYAREHWAGRANVLDLTYHLSNTQERSRSFIEGLQGALGAEPDVLSLNALGRYDIAYQLTRDALVAHPEINIVFGINDTAAAAALLACRDLHIDPARLIVIPFGLEGDTLRNALLEATYCRAGVAMFPELVGPLLVEAARAACAQEPLPPQLVTPHAVLTSETLLEYYRPSPDGWQLRAPNGDDRLKLPLPIRQDGAAASDGEPLRIGFLVRFMEHEWYRNLFQAMRDYANGQGIQIELEDAEQSLREEVQLRRREIARCAAEEVQPGDVVMVDDGPISDLLAEELRHCENITVITNVTRVLDALRDSEGVSLISTGGVLRRITGVLVGPTTETTLRTLHADKLFLMVTGASHDFGLSDTDIPEVTVKQAMLHSAREVILLADHTCFGHDSVIHFAPLTAIHKLISDDGLPASWRLDLRKLGIEVVLASM